jgi:hypothetical protein
LNWGLRAFMPLELCPSHVLHFFDVGFRHPERTNLPVATLRWAERSGPSYVCPESWANPDENVAGTAFSVTTRCQLTSGRASGRAAASTHPHRKCFLLRLCCRPALWPSPL